VRSLRRQPGYSLVIVLTLALGIGGTTVMFSAVYGIVLSPLEYPDGDRLLALSTPERESGRAVSTSLPDMRDIVAQANGIERAAGFRFASFDLTASLEPEQIRVAWVTEEFFDVFRVAPIIGRAFAPEEVRSAPQDVIVLEHGLWLRQFGGDPNAVGQSLVLDGRTYQIIGVMPPGFKYPDYADAWLPTATPDGRGARPFTVVAMKRAGVDLEAVRGELAVVGRRLTDTYPETNAEITFDVKPLREHIVGEAGTGLVLLLVAAGLVLLTASTNVAHMAFARGAAREREIAVRLALGAGRRHVVGQLLTESCLLALAGGALGIAIALWSLPVLRTVAPWSLPRINEVSIDGFVLGVSLVISMATGLLFGIVPAMRSARTDVQTALRVTSGPTAHGVSALGRRFLVISEVALTVILVVGAGLFLKSLAELRGVDLGFDPAPVAMLGLVLPDNEYPQTETVVAFFRDLVERLERDPRIDHAAASNYPPFWSGQQSTASVPGVDLETDPAVAWRVATPGLFATMGIPLERGRDFDARDAASGAPPSAIINRTMAERYFTDVDRAIDRGVTLSLFGRPYEATVVGVVGDVRNGHTSEPIPEMFLPHAQQPWRYMNVVVRGTIEAEELVAVLREGVADLDPRRPVFTAGPFSQIVTNNLAVPRFYAGLLAVFAVLAMLLAAVGIYGVISYGVNRRVRELGIRLALGARRAAVIRLVVGQALTLVLLGAAAGILGALVLTRTVSSLLHGVSPADPAVYAAGTVGLLLVGALAAYVPARRASRLSPVKTLRAE
jgi:predicted permease